MLPRKGVWVFLPLIGFIAMAILLASSLGKNTEDLPTALAGKPLPQMQLPSLLRKGNTVENSLFEGRWTLLNVWATWCPTCHIEHPYLLELAQRGVAIVGLDYKDEDAAAKNYLANLGNPYVEVPVDASGAYGLNLGVYGAPETYLISPQGDIVLRHVGEMNERVWQAKFLPLISEPLKVDSDARPETQSEKEAQ